MGLILRSPDIVETVRENAIAAQRVETMMTARARAPLDTWHNIGAPGEPTFQSGWSNYGQGTNPARYFRDPSGFVHLGGVVQPPSPFVYASNITIFTMPTGYRPPYAEYQGVLEYYTSSGVGSSTMMAMIVPPTGDVVLYAPAGTPLWVSLDDHLFRNQ